MPNAPFLPRSCFVVLHCRESIDQAVTLLIKLDGNEPYFTFLSGFVLGYLTGDAESLSASCNYFNFTLIPPQLCN